MQVLAGKTHYMSWPHPATGVKSPSWSVRIFKDGDLRLDIGYEVTETAPRYYTLNFDNDGGHNSQWTAIVSLKDAPGIGYTESWLVIKPITEQGVTEIRTRNNTEDGGFFGFAAKGSK